MLTVPRMKLFSATLLFLFFAGGAASAQAQRWGLPDPMRDEPPPKSIRESLEKMRIEGAKKDYAEMLKRSEDAVKLATDLEGQMAKNGRLTETELEKVTEVEKLVKKIRGDLGARDGDDLTDELDDENAAPATTREAVETLRRSAVSLCDELKNTSRFTVSGPAIQTTNALLKVTRFLRFAN